MWSLVPSHAGMREKPPSIAAAIALSIVSSASTVTMSGRGCITSRTTVSPNSKIEWMSARSSRSIASSSAATSAIVRISSSVTNGPSLRPLPGRITLAKPMRPRDEHADRPERGEEPQQRRDAQRGAVGVLDRVGLRRDLGDHEEEHDLHDGADEHRDARRVARASTPTSVAAVNWHTRTSEQHRVERAGRAPRACAASFPAPRLPSSSSWMARMRLIFVKAVSDSASTADTAKSTNTATSRPQSAPLTAVSPPARGTSRGAPAPGLHHGRLLLLGVVVVEQVQHAVHHEQRELVVERARVLGRLALRDERAHDDVAEHDRRVGGLGRRARAATTGVGLAARRARGRRRSGTRARRWGRCRRGT